MDCGECNAEKAVPYLVHEGVMVRFERTIRRLWIIIILLIAVLVGTNIAWLVYESQFEDVVITADQTAEQGGNNYAVGGDFAGD